MIFLENNMQHLYKYRLRIIHWMFLFLPFHDSAAHCNKLNFKETLPRNSVLQNKIHTLLNQGRNMSIVVSLYEI
jgi:hypothetical protein